MSDSGELSPAAWAEVIGQLQAVLDRASAECAAHEAALPAGDDPAAVDSHAADRLAGLIADATARAEEAARRATAAEDALLGPARDWEEWGDRLRSAAGRLAAPPRAGL